MLNLLEIIFFEPQDPTTAIGLGNQRIGQRRWEWREFCVLEGFQMGMDRSMGKKKKKKEVVATWVFGDLLLWFAVWEENLLWWVLGFAPFGVSLIQFWQKRGIEIWVLGFFFGSLIRSLLFLPLASSMLLVQNLCSFIRSGTELGSNALICVEFFI